ARDRSIRALKRVAECKLRGWIAEGYRARGIDAKAAARRQPGLAGWRGIDDPRGRIDHDDRNPARLARAEGKAAAGRLAAIEFGNPTQMGGDAGEVPGASHVALHVRIAAQQREKKEATV